MSSSGPLLGYPHSISSEGVIDSGNYLKTGKGGASDMHTEVNIKGRKMNYVYRLVSPSEVLGVRLYRDPAEPL